MATTSWTESMSRRERGTRSETQDATCMRRCPERDGHREWCSGGRSAPIRRHEPVERAEHLHDRVSKPQDRRSRCRSQSWVSTTEAWPIRLSVAGGGHDSRGDAGMRGEELSVPCNLRSPVPQSGPGRPRADQVAHEPAPWTDWCSSVGGLRARSSPCGRSLASAAEAGRLDQPTA